MKRSFLAFFTVLSLFLTALAAPVSALPLTSQDIAKMVQECPVLEDYKGERAVIWNRKLLYTQDNQGRMVRTTSYVILCSPLVRLNWLFDQLVAPEGGEIELEQASVFDPGTAKLIRQLRYDADLLKKEGRFSFVHPAEDDVYVLALSYRQYFGTPGAMEDFVWLGAEYPVWEGSIQVRIPKKSELLYSASNNTEPAIEEDSQFRRYGWFYFKQPANHGVAGMLDTFDPYVAFSLQKGPATTLAMMNSLEKRSWPALPADCIVKDGDAAASALRSLEKFWRSGHRLSVRGIWRDAGSIPQAGPWTTWEAAYMAAAWLKKQGWKAEVWFLHHMPLARDSLCTVSGLYRPVLELTEPASKKHVYYIPDQPGDMGPLPLSLRGKTLYAAAGKKLRKKSLGGAKLEKNRFSIAWNLSVDADCLVSGTGELRVRQNWVDVFEGLTDGNKERLYALLPGMESWIGRDTELDITPLGREGFKVTFPVKVRSGIEGKTGIIIGLPVIAPGPMQRLLDVDSACVLKFPFVVEQSYRVRLPKGYRAMVPLKQDQGSPVSTYTSRCRINQRTNTLESDEKLVQSSARVEGYEVNSFKHVIAFWGAWKRSNLALLRH